MISACELIQNLQSEWQSRKEICRFYRRGECNKGEKCKFIHTITGDLGILQDAASLVGTELLFYALDPELNKVREQTNTRPDANVQSSNSSLSFHEALKIALEKRISPEEVDAGPQSLPSEQTETRPAERQIIVEALTAVYKDVCKSKPYRTVLGTCVVCMEKEITCGLLHQDSMHVCCCTPCGRKMLSKGLCPICRRQIDKVVSNVYLVASEDSDGE